MIKAEQAGLDVVALTDHDTFDGLDEAVAEGQRIGVTVVRGLELSCSRQGNSVHLLGVRRRPGSAALAAELEKVRGGRMGRLAPVLERLAELGVPVTEEQVLAEMGDSPSMGRPHIADAMVKAGHVRDRTEAFDRFLADGGPAHVPRYAIEIHRGIDLVHPGGRRGGDRPSLGPRPRARAAAEVPARSWPSITGSTGSRSITMTTTRTPVPGCAQLADDLGLLATGSSDYHGTGKLDHDLGSNTTDPAVYHALVARLRVPAPG